MFTAREAVLGGNVVSFDRYNSDELLAAIQSDKDPAIHRKRPEVKVEQYQFKVPTLFVLVGDIGGTFGDPLCLLPFKAFQSAFERVGLSGIDPDVLSAPMGKDKLEHIQEVLAHDSVRPMLEFLKQRFTDIAAYASAIHLAYLDEQKQLLEKHLKPLPHVQELSVLLQDDSRFGAENLSAITATTGFSKTLVDTACSKLVDAGVACHDVWPSDPEKAEGKRPNPHGLLSLVEKQIKRYQGKYAKLPEHVVVLKMGDTDKDIHEGNNAMRAITENQADAFAKFPQLAALVKAEQVTGVNVATTDLCSHVASFAEYLGANAKNDFTAINVKRAELRAQAEALGAIPIGGASDVIDVVIPTIVSTLNATTAVPKPAELQAAVKAQTDAAYEAYPAQVAEVAVHVAAAGI